MRKFTLLMALTACISLLHAQTSPDYIFGVAGADWVTGVQGTQVTSGVYQWQFTAAATGDQFFKLGETAASADASGFWTNGEGTDMTYTGAGAMWDVYYKANMGDGGAVKFAATTGNYYIIHARKNSADANAKFAIFESPSAIATISSVTQAFASPNLTVTVNASVAPAAVQKFWVRYTKDNWATSAIIEATVTGTAGTAVIDATGADKVEYYVFTTVQAPAGFTDYDFYAVSLNNNGGKNYNYQISPLTGEYFIPKGTNPKGFVSIADAFKATNEAGLNGTVTFFIDNNLSEIGANVLLNRSDLSATNNLVIKPATDKTPTVTFTGCVATTGASQYSGLAISNTGFVTIDGSNTAGGTSKDLTFKMNDGTNGRNIIQLYGNCDNSSVKNLNILYQSPMSTATSTRGIYLNGQSTGACDNFTVENCEIGSATLTPYYGVGATGSSGSTIYCTNIIIKNNNIYGRIRPVYLYYVGTTGTSSEVTGNTIYTYGGVNGTTTYTIMWNTWAGTLNIKNNKIPVLSVANTSGTSGVYGISGLSAATGSVVNMSNNFVGGVNGSTGVAVPSIFSLMYIQDNATYNIFNNTFYYQSLTNATEKSNIHISGSTCIVNLKNNIIINETDAATAYCIWKSNGTLTSDYNDLYVSGPTANIGYLTSARKTLENWQAAFTPNNDLNSKSSPVYFADKAAGNLSIAGTSINDPDLSAPALAAVTTDIFGTTRFAPLVYKGAHEASDLNLPAPTKVFTVTAPVGTEKVYVAGSFTGKNWDITTPYELTATANPYEFSGTFACADGVEYKYLNGVANWDYVEATAAGTSLTNNRTYNASDNVPFWFASPKVKLNVSFPEGSPIPSNLFVKGSWDSWATGIALTESSTPLYAPGAQFAPIQTVSFTGTIGNGTTSVIYSNMEYKYYTNDMVADNWEVITNNRWVIYPLMYDEIASFTTPLPASGISPAKEMSVRFMRTPMGITALFDGNAVVELYSINGALIEKTNATGSYSRELNHGAYIIRINGKATKFVK